MNPYEQAACYADRIELELLRIGAWQEEPPPPEAFLSNAPFLADNMSYYQWLQFVLLDRVRRVVESNGRFPDRSEVGMQATREFDGLPEASALTAVLNEFDDFIVALTAERAPETSPNGDPSLVVPQFLVAARNRDASAVRAVLSANSRGFSSYESGCEIESADYLAGAAVRDGDGFKVPCDVMVCFPDGRSEERSMVVYVVEEEGQWKVDLPGTYQRTMQSIVDRAMAVMAESARFAEQGDFDRVAECNAQCDVLRNHMEHGLTGMGVDSTWLNGVANGCEPEPEAEPESEDRGDPQPPPYLMPLVAEYWRMRRVGQAAEMETREPWPESGGDVELAARVIGTATFLGDVCGEPEPCEEGVMVNTILDAGRGPWLIRTVLREEEGQWRVDPVLTVERTAALYRRYQHIHPPYTDEETPRGRAMEFWHQVARHDRRRAAKLATPGTPPAEVPVMGDGQVDEFFWYIDEHEEDGAVRVRVLMNVRDDQRMLHTVMVEREGTWFVDLAATLACSGFEVAVR